MLSTACSQRNHHHAWTVLYVHVRMCVRWQLRNHLAQVDYVDTYPVGKHTRYHIHEPLKYS
jgi:hypothetical protein